MGQVDEQADGMGGDGYGLRGPHARAGGNARHEAPHAWTNGFGGLGADWELMLLCAFSVCAFLFPSVRCSSFLLVVICRIMSRRALLVCSYTMYPYEAMLVRDM